MTMEHELDTDKMVTTLGVSECVIPKDNGAKNVKEMEWTFVLPVGTKIHSDITKKGGTVSFTL